MPSLLDRWDHCPKFAFPDSMKRTQLLLPCFERMSLVHGGEHSVGKRKTQRPISTKKPMHIVMRSTRASGAISLRGSGQRGMVESLLMKYKRRFSIKIYKYSINSNHIHLAVRAYKRENLQNFLRAFAGELALQLLRKFKLKGKFWDLLAFSRLVEWGKSFRNLIEYVVMNQKEAVGLIAYRPRSHANRRNPGPAP